MIISLGNVQGLGPFGIYAVYDGGARQSRTRLFMPPTFIYILSFPTVNGNFWGYNNSTSHVILNSLRDICLCTPYVVKGYIETRLIISVLLKSLLSCLSKVCPPIVKVLVAMLLYELVNHSAVFCFQAFVILMGPYTGNVIWNALAGTQVS